MPISAGTTKHASRCHWAARARSSIVRTSALPRENCPRKAPHPPRALPEPVSTVGGLHADQVQMIGCVVGAKCLLMTYPLEQDAYADRCLCRMIWSSRARNRSSVWCCWSLGECRWRIRTASTNSKILDYTISVFDDSCEVKSPHIRHN